MRRPYKLHTEKNISQDLIQESCCCEATTTPCCHRWCSGYKIRVLSEQMSSLGMVWKWSWRPISGLLFNYNLRPVSAAVEREKYVDDSSFIGNSSPSNPFEQIAVVFPVCRKSERVTVDHINRNEFGERKTFRKIFQSLQQDQDILHYFSSGYSVNLQWPNDSSTYSGDLSYRISWLLKNSLWLF